MIDAAALNDAAAYRYDQFGREMTQRELWRQLNHQFHGIKPSAKRAERELLSYVFKMLAAVINCNNLAGTRGSCRLRRRQMLTRRWAACRCSRRQPRWVWVVVMMMLNLVLSMC